MDREKLDLLLTLNGKPVPNLFQGEIILKQQISKVERLMKEQASQLLEERSLMKAEWDKEKRLNENTYKTIKQRYIITIFVFLTHPEDPNIVFIFVNAGLENYKNSSS